MIYKETGSLKRICRYWIQIISQPKKSPREDSLQKSNTKNFQFKKKIENGYIQIHFLRPVLPP